MRKYLFIVFGVLAASLLFSNRTEAMRPKPHHQDYLRPRYKPFDGNHFGGFLGMSHFRFRTMVSEGLLPMGPFSSNGIRFFPTTPQQAQEQALIFAGRQAEDLAKIDHFFLTVGNRRTYLHISEDEAGLFRSAQYRYWKIMNAVHSGPTDFDFKTVGQMFETQVQKLLGMKSMLGRTRGDVVNGIQAARNYNGVVVGLNPSVLQHPDLSYFAAEGGREIAMVSRVGMKYPLSIQSVYNFDTFGDFDRLEIQKLVDLDPNL